MDCQTAIEYINLYADNMLNKKESGQLLSHIGSCGKCKKEFDDILAVKKALAGLGEINPPAGLAISAIRKAKRRKIPVFAYASAGIAAVITLVVVFSSSIFNNSSNSGQNRLASAAETTSEALAGGAAMQDASVEEAVPDYALAPVPAATMLPETEGEIFETRKASEPYIIVPDEVSENFKESLERFLEDNDIDREKYGDAKKETISFTIAEDKLVSLKSLVEKSFQDGSFKYGSSKDELLRSIEELKAGFISFIFSK